MAYSLNTEDGEASKSRRGSETSTADELHALSQTLELQTSR
jgi:hypothetical protein